MFNLLQISIKLNNYHLNIFNILKSKYKYPCKFFPPPIYLWSDSRRLFSNGQQHQQNQQIQKIQVRKKNFDEVLHEHREQSKRSVLIQVSSEKSYPELFSYCSQFGNIIGSYHYTIPQYLQPRRQQTQQDELNDSHYILLEFSNSSEVDSVLKSSVYDGSENIVPAISHFLWFRSGPKPSLSNLKCKPNLTITNGTQQMNTTQELNDWLQSAETLDDQIILLHRSSHLNEIGIRLRFLAAQQVENCMFGIFPYCQVFPFGSSISGFGKIGCDLDLILSLNSDDHGTNDPSKRLVYHIKETSINGRSQIQRQMETISDILQLFLPGVSHVRRILQARIPIIRYHHEYLDVEIDLSMTNLTGFYMSEILYMFGQIDERVQPIVFCVRRWAQSVGLTNSSPGRWISNFSLTCLVIYFFQQLKSPILPSINYIMKSARPEDFRIINNENINCTFLRDINQLNFNTTNNDKLGDLLLQFFEFYSQMDFGNRAISLNEGKTILKPDHSAIYIVNPLEPLLNVSKNVSLEECERFRIAVRNAAWILESSMEEQFKATKSIVTTTTTSSLSSSSSSQWGLLNIFQTPNETCVRPHMFFQTRLVDVSDLFEDEKNLKLNSNKNNNINVSDKSGPLLTNNNDEKVAADKLSTATNIIYKNNSVKKHIENIQKEGRLNIINKFKLDNLQSDKLSRSTTNRKKR